MQFAICSGQFAGRAENADGRRDAQGGRRSRPDPACRAGAVAIAKPAAACTTADACMAAERPSKKHCFTIGLIVLLQRVNHEFVDDDMSGLVGNEDDAAGHVFVLEPPAVRGSALRIGMEI